MTNGSDFARFEHLACAESASLELTARAALFSVVMLSSVTEPPAELAIRSTEASIAFQQLGITLAHRSAGARVGACMLQLARLSQT